jgi:hypothetical protein
VSACGKLEAKNRILIYKDVDSTLCGNAAKIDETIRMGFNAPETLGYEQPRIALRVRDTRLVFKSALLHCEN